MLSTYSWARKRPFSRAWCTVLVFFLLSVAVVLLGRGIAAIVGSAGRREGPAWKAMSRLLLSRLFPGLILVTLGLMVTGLGVLEIAAPATFDGLGDVLLEAVHSLTQ